MRISQVVFIISATIKATPNCQVISSEAAIPQTAVDTAKRRGMSLLTRRLSTLKGRKSALPPRTTITLKILLPTMLLKARLSDPVREELTLTNSSGALVPRDTIVKPITS